MNSTFAYFATGTRQVVVRRLGYLGHGTIPLSADCDGDRKTDFDYFDPTTSTFDALPSGGGAPLVQPFGYLRHGNEPIPAAAPAMGVPPQKSLRAARPRIVGLPARPDPGVRGASPRD